MINRYIQQERLKAIGPEGQKKLASSRAAIVGVGGLGCAQAAFLCRAGIGFLRIIDRDCVELSNLHRQILYTERDVSDGLPKVTAAGRHLREINREICIEEADGGLTCDNAEILLGDMDLVLDATDNLETRCLINEVCVKRGIPWIYGGVAATEGMTMNILPGGPCFSCLTGLTESHAGKTESRPAGILNTLPSLVASVQCTEALKILLGSETVRRGLLIIDPWECISEELPVAKNPACPVCGKTHRGDVCL